MLLKNTRFCWSLLSQKHNSSLFPSIYASPFKNFSTATPPKASATNTSKNGQVVVITSGKGGVGKTTTAASFSLGLANRGYRTCAIDFDIGLRNLDIHFGMERRVVYDLINVINGDVSPRQALIKDKRNENLYMLAASQTKDKTALKMDEVEKALDELRREFDYIVCDSPAGIESGAHHAMYWSDSAIICLNPEMASIRDSDKMIGIIQSKSKRAVEGREPVKLYLLITRYQPERARDGQIMPVKEIKEILGNLPVVGVVPESSDVIQGINVGKPIITFENSDAREAYLDMVSRFLGEDIPMKFLEPKRPRGFFGNLQNLFGKS